LNLKQQKRKKHQNLDNLIETGKYNLQFFEFLEKIVRKSVHFYKIEEKNYEILEIFLKKTEKFGIFIKEKHGNLEIFIKKHDIFCKK
jgi:hypothetical protein